MTRPSVPEDVDVTSDHAEDTTRDPFDELAEEFAERCRRGESPSITEYVERYPEHERKIRDLLPPVAMMERLKGRLQPGGLSSSLHEPRLERLDDYRIIRELGRGGMGIVYEAVQESLERHVALKVIPRHGLLDTKRRQRFQREAQAVAQLHHTNIVPIFAAGEHEGLPYYAMQYIRGNGLDRLLEGWRREGRARDEAHRRSVARVGIQAAEALQYAHEQGILHRDIKPANLLIDEHQTAWITDFGLAKLAGLEDLTNSGDIVGTLRYLAPEALRGQTDARSDIYSLGLTLYELLTLKLPFGDLSPSELLRCVTEEQPIRPRKLDRSIPLDLETIILKATAREPAHRYATAGELADDLRAFLDDRPIKARRASPPERLARWCRRNKGLAALAALTAAAIVFAFGALTAGYVMATRARERADRNVKLSLDAFEDLFNEFTDPEDAGPFADGAQPMPGRGFGRPRLEPTGPPPDRRAGPGGFGKAGPPPRGGGGGPPPGRPFRPGSNLSDREIAVLETVLDFYDKFAERNETNATLQVDAARAYRKVAALYYSWFPREQDSVAARARSLARFETLVARNGQDPDLAYDLARTLAMDVLGEEADRTVRPESDLRRAITIVEQLAARATVPKQGIPYAAALARWNSWLAAMLEEGGNASDAEACYRESLRRDDWLAEQFGHPPFVRWVQAKNRLSLARLLFRQGRRDEARAELDHAAADVRTVTEDGRPLHRDGEKLAVRFEDLAKSCKDLGDDPRAAELSALAKRIRERSRQEPHGSHRGRVPDGNHGAMRGPGPGRPGGSRPDIPPGSFP